MPGDSRLRGRGKLFRISTAIMSRHLSASVLLSALVFVSCASTASSPPQLPGEVKMNASAGRWGLLLVTLRLEGGQELPLVIDTGSSWTLFDKSLEKKLGRRLGTETLSSWSGRTEATAYSAPKVCLGGTALVVEKALACNLKRLKSPSSARGVLGMDCLEHYCIQLDFQAGKIRFLDPERVGAAELGAPFPLAFRGKLP